MRSDAADSTMYALSGNIGAAPGLAAPEQTCGIHAHAVAIGLHGNVVVGTALVYAYGKAGVVDAYVSKLEDANRVARTMSC